MNLTKLTDRFSVAGQIDAADVTAIANAGFQAVICNRPDGEGPGQPLYRDIESAAKAQGLDVHYLPVVSGRLTADNVRDFDALMALLPRPVLAYCRSGARCTQLWELSASSKTG